MNLLNTYTDYQEIFETIGNATSRNTSKNIEREAGATDIEYAAKLARRVFIWNCADYYYSDENEDEDGQLIYDWVETDWDDMIKALNEFEYEFISRTEVKCLFCIRDTKSSVKVPKPVEGFEGAIKYAYDKRGGYQDQYIYLQNGAFIMNGYVFYVFNEEVCERILETGTYLGDDVFDYEDIFLNSFSEIEQDYTQEKFVEKLRRENLIKDIFEIDGLTT